LISGIQVNENLCEPNLLNGVNVLPVAERGSINLMAGLMAGIEYIRDGCGVEGRLPLSGHFTPFTYVRFAKSN